VTRWLFPDRAVAPCYHRPMRRLVIADAHIGQSDGDVEAMCLLVDRAAEEGFDEIVYLGDAFQYLLGMSKFWSESVVEVLRSWDRARRRGVRLVVIEGNRDFFLDEPDLGRRVDVAGRTHRFEAGGVRYLLVHGDKVNRRDLQYRFWSTVSKSWPARLWARLLPRTLAVRIVESMEARLAETNRRYRYVKPVEDLRREAERSWAAGVHVLLWGHFHTPWQHRDGDRLAMVVPAWLETRVALEVEADGRRRWLDGSLTALERLPTMEP